MKCYVIDPVAQTITEDTYSGHYTDFYRMLSGPNAAGGETKVDLFDVIHLSDDGDTLYVDDEGLLKDDQSFFEFAGYPQPLAGRGVVIGTNDEGETVEPQCSLDWVSARVKFLTAEEVVRPDPAFHFIPLS